MVTELPLRIHKMTQLLTVLLTLLLYGLETPAVERITYIHFDALGSPLAGSNSSGQRVWREEYKPYGDRLDGSETNNKIWYTGKVHDPEIGLSYYGARWYSPVVGRFMGVDPVAFHEANPKSFNQYAYANNNPYTYVDPDGRNPVVLIWIAKEVGSALVEHFTGVPVPSVSGLGKQAIKQGIKQASKDNVKGGTYKLTDADGIVKRTGKSKDLDRRRGEHARNSETKDLEFEVDRRTDCCNAQRGREQIIYDQHPEAQSINGGLNKRRPVSPTNRKRHIYRKAGEEL